MNIIDGFFKLGEKATKGDITQKAKFDYYLYWIVFLAFVSIAVNYYYSFFTGNGKISTLIWAIIITIFCWFNYWGLVSFRTNYQNMKEAKEKLDKIKPINNDSVKEMMEDFK